MRTKKIRDGGSMLYNRRQIIRRGVGLAGATYLQSHVTMAMAQVAGSANGVTEPQRALCEGLIDPLGLQMARPRLSWICSDARQGARQAA